MESDEVNTGKAKLFIENFIVYGLGGVISKLIPLIMLPIITRLMPDTSYFGISDMSNTVVSFGSALAVIGMYDAMYRMFFEKEDLFFRKKICSTTLLFTVIMSIITASLMIVTKNIIAKYFFGNTAFAYLVYISAITTLVSATNQIVSLPTRMQNKRKIYFVTNMISPILSYSIAIPLMLKGHAIIALPVAALITGISLEVTFWVLNRHWFYIRLFDFKLLKQLLIIAIPLFPNFIIYWIFNSCDKIMITNILNIGEAGIYSIGGKLAQVSQLIYIAFAGGWQFFAFSTMREKNQVESNSKVFEYLAAISLFCLPFVFAFSRMIFCFIFPDNYSRGFIIAPYLFMAPLMQMLFQVASNQFIVIKKTWSNMFILLGGALLNVSLNIILIPTIGIEGAAIATLLGYLCSDIIVCIVLCKMKLMIIYKRTLRATFLVVLYILFWRFVIIYNDRVSILCAFMASSGVLILYKYELTIIYMRIRRILFK